MILLTVITLQNAVKRHYLEVVLVRADPHMGTPLHGLDLVDLIGYEQLPSGLGERHSLLLLSWLLFDDLGALFLYWSLLKIV